MDRQDQFDLFRKWVGGEPSPIDPCVLQRSHKNDLCKQRRTARRQPVRVERWSFLFEKWRGSLGLQWTIRPRNAEC